MGDEKYEVVVKEKVVKHVTPVLKDREIIEVLENIAKEYIEKDTDCAVVDIKLLGIKLYINVKQAFKDDLEFVQEYPTNIEVRVER